MSSPVKFLTHSDRAYRREKVAADLRDGKSVGEVAARHNLSASYIKEVARNTNLARPVGRPRLLDCPVLRKQYSNLSKKVTARVARQIMGLPL